MTLKHMKIFLEVCRQGSITLAAEELNMTQPAVSVAISKMEEYYNVKLFDRMNRTIYLTEAGKKVLTYAVSIVQEFDNVKNALEIATQQSTLKIGSNAALGELLLPDLIKEFSLKYPEVHLSITIDHSSQIEHMLLKNQLDLAILDNESSAPLFEDYLLVRKQLDAFCSLSYTLQQENGYTLGMLSKLPLLLREKGSGPRNMIEELFLSNGFSVNCILGSSSMTALTHFAQNGMGILITDSESVHDLVEQNLLRPLPIHLPELRSSCHLLYHRRKSLTDPMDQFIQFAASRFQDENYTDYVI